MQEEKKKEQIIEALIRLLNNIPLEKITVQDIIREAKVSRATFYRCYIDKYDLAIQVYERMVNFALDAYPSLYYWNKEWATMTHHRLQAHRVVLKNILSYRGQNSFHDHLFYKVKYLILTYRKNRDIPLTKDQSYVIDAFSRLWANAYADWILNDFMPGEDDFLRQVDLCIPEFIRPFFEKE